MDPLPAAGLAAAGGYVSGSIPFAYLAVRLRTGKDLRTLGSGNVGATNATRVLGRSWFLLLFLLDFAKGALPVVAAGMAARAPGFDPADALWVRAAAGAGAILGHLFPVFLGFRGGKGVATGAGVIALLVPDAFLAGLAGFALPFLATRFVSLGSVVGAIAAAAWLFWSRRAAPSDQVLPVGLLVGTVAAAIVIRHVPNLRRIAAGTEPRAFAPHAPAPPGGAP